MKQSKQQLLPPAPPSPSGSPLARRTHRFNIMIDEVLPRAWQQDFWESISSSPAGEFLSTQQDIMNILLGDQKLFESFFKRFYLNHLQLHHWYILARENQLELKKYVFAPLLANTYRHYRQIVKDEQVRHNFARMNDLSRQDASKDKKKESFHKMHLGKGREGRVVPCSSSLCEEKERRKQLQFMATLQQFSREDYHQLFLKTFNACDGSKYIYYDFDRHMRGMEQQKQYNSYIRIKKHTRMHQSLTLKEEDRPPPSAKENSQSTYITDPASPYFHEGEEKLEKMVYCNYSWSAIGSVNTATQSREQHVLKRLPNVFKKLKPSQTAKAFHLRKKKVL